VRGASDEMRFFKDFARLSRSERSGTGLAETFGGTAAHAAPTPEKRMIRTVAAALAAFALISTARAEDAAKPAAETTKTTTATETKKTEKKAPAAEQKTEKKTTEEKKEAPK
jgi:hypothetical protein